MNCRITNLVYSKPNFRSCVHKSVESNRLSYKTNGIKIRWINIIYIKTKFLKD